jgi:predicted DNA-binding transcriptional regulator YafY
MTAAELAAELEVSVRTVYRDAESLSAAGVPLYGDAGPDGGYRLVEGYRTRLTGLTGREAESLFLAGLPGPAAELGLGPVVAAAQLKLLAALPPELRDRAGRGSGRFHLDAPGWYHDAEDVPHLAAAADAVWNERVLRVRYRRWREPREISRELRPYGLVLKAGRWYLVAEGERRVSTYRVSQVLELETTGERFTRPPEFDLAGHWRTALAEFEAGRRRGEAVIRLSPRGVQRLPDNVSPAAARTALRGATGPDAEGWVRVVIPVESTAHATGELLRLGADVEVLEPAELRESIACEVAALARVYS